MIRILSLGAGVQSTTVLLMSENGVLPKLDCAIFADTGWEPDEVYEHLERLKQTCKTPIHVVRAGDLRAASMRFQVHPDRKTLDTDRWASMPMFVENPDSTSGKINRQCTSDYKIDPIERLMKRAVLGLKPRQRAPQETVIEHWYGISVDEAQRMRTSPVRWKVNSYPLCGWPTEYLPKTYSRADCLEWLRANWPHPVPRSACLGCPYHSDAEWRRIKANPKYWSDVTEFDRAIRNSGGMRGKVYLHRSLKPLDEVDFSTAEDRGQLNMFNNECLGMCGV